MESDKVQLPRHKTIVEFLTSKAPKRYSATEIAKHTKLSPRTVANEMPVILQLYPQVQRSVRKPTYQYYVGAPDSQAELGKGFETWGKPLTAIEVGNAYGTIFSSNYQSAPARLAWKLQFALANLAQAALSGDLSSISSARQAVEELSDAATAYAVSMSRILSTAELWDDPRWLVQGLNEEALEDLAKFTQKALDTVAQRASVSSTDQPTKEQD